MMSPCLIEHGIGRTSMTLSGPMRTGVCNNGFMFWFLFFQLKISDARRNTSLLGHHARMPRRIPNDLHIHIRDAVKSQQRPLHALRNAFMHWTARRGERHLDDDARAVDLHAVNKAEVNDVAAEFRVNDLTQRFEDEFVSDGLSSHSVTVGGVTPCAPRFVARAAGRGLPALPASGLS